MVDLCLPLLRQTMTGVLWRIRERGRTNLLEGLSISIRSRFFGETFQRSLLARNRAHLAHDFIRPNLYPGISLNLSFMNIFLQKLTAPFLIGYFLCCRRQRCSHRPQLFHRLIHQSDSQLPPCIRIKDWWKPAGVSIYYET
jgi:hypothetical protein